MLIVYPRSSAFELSYFKDTASALKTVSKKGRAGVTRASDMRAGLLSAAIDLTEKFDSGTKKDISREMVSNMVDLSTLLDELHDAKATHSQFCSKGAVCSFDADNSAVTTIEAIVTSTRQFGLSFL